MAEKKYALLETGWLDKKTDYDGSQLRSHYVREVSGIINDGLIAFTGECDVRGDSLVDLEDAEAGSYICAREMLHFIAEHFQCPLREANLRLRLLITIVRETLERTVPGIHLERRGDDLYYEDRKLSVAIATVGPTSALMHCGIDIDPAGAPVPAAGLKEIGVDPEALAADVLKSYAQECESIELAVRKVRGV